jgi:hypothetical protein
MTKKVTFTALPHWTGSAWQGGSTLPDAKIGWCILNQFGGHPGKNPGFNVIRRWTAPADGIVAVTGNLAHPNKEGDGVRGRLVVDGQVLGEWKVKDGNADTNRDKITVKKGAILDFVVDCVGDESHDAFAWAPTIALQAKAEQRFNATADFHGPRPPAVKAGSWEQLAQVLLLSNEFAFVD